MIEIVGTELNQWDVGRLVHITGVEAEYAHFANKGDSKAVIMGVVDIEAKIPDYLLQTGKPLCVYAVKDGITIESKTFYVKHRERPENYVYEADQRNYIYALITNAETAIDAANNAYASATLATENANKSAASANEAADSANISAKNANEAADSANTAAKNANESASKAAHTAKSLMVIGEAKGTNTYLDDAIDQFLVGMRIFGKTTQDGTPTPEDPAELVSVGDVGSVTITVAGKNLISNNWLQGMLATEDGTTLTRNDYWVTNADYISVDSGKSYVFSADTANFSCVFLYDEYKNFISYEQPLRNRVFNVLMFPDHVKFVRVAYNYSGATEAITPATMGMNRYVQLEFGSNATKYQTHMATTATVTTTTEDGNRNGLAGIPVASGGNYTDANGQQWICDEIDFARGVYVQRVGVVSKKMRQYSLKAMPIQNGLFQVLDFKVKPFSPVMSNLFIEGYTQNVNYSISTNRGNNDYAYFYYREYTTTEELISAKGEVTLTIVYVLENPIETPLAEEELAACANLHTYRGNTTVFNDALAHMELEYVMDAKTYISRLVGGVTSAARIVNVSLPASKWTGSGTLYSQVVSIEGVTENSQVNLTPSVQQISIFYEKDITFITENDGGVITVYVIGQKPVNDYTIPANIVEVIA